MFKKESYLFLFKSCHSAFDLVLETLLWDLFYDWVITPVENIVFAPAFYIFFIIFFLLVLFFKYPLSRLFFQMIVYMFLCLQHENWAHSLELITKKSRELYAIQEASFCMLLKYLTWTFFPCKSRIIGGKKISEKSCVCEFSKGFFSFTGKERCRKVSFQTSG